MTPVAKHRDVETGYPHIVRRPGVVGGRARVTRTRVPVWQIANLWRMGETISDLLEAFPRVSPAALHGALSYYWDHQDEVDAEIEENRPENVMAELRRDPRLIEEAPGVFRGKIPSELRPQ